MNATSLTVHGQQGKHARSTWRVNAICTTLCTRHESNGPWLESLVWLEQEGRLKTRSLFLCRGQLDWFSKLSIYCVLRQQWLRAAWLSVPKCERTSRQAVSMTIRLNIVKSRAASLKHTGCWSKPVHNHQVVRKRIPRRWVVESLQLEPCLPHARSGRGALHVDDRRNKAAHLTTNFRRTETNP